MTGSRMTALLVALAACACGSGNSSALTDAHADALSDSVSAMLAEYASQLRQANWDSVIQFFADDPRFHWIEDGSLRYGSHADVAAALRQVEGAFASSEVTHSDIRVLPLAPGIAAVSTSFRQSLTDTTGASFSFSGAVTLTAWHTTGGWKFLTGHTSALNPRNR